MLWGALSVNAASSWELHASGIVVGVILAFVFRHDDLPPVKRYDWEWEDEAGNPFEDDEEGGGPRDRWP